MHALLNSLSLTLQQANANPCLHQRFLDIHGQAWVILLWGHCSFFLVPGAHKVLSVPSKSLFPHSCVTSGGSVVGLMATSSKRAYAIPMSAAPRAPVHAAGHSWSIPPQETQTQFWLTFPSLTMLKPLTVWTTTNWEIAKKMGIPDHLLASWETCMQVKKQQLELDIEQQMVQNRERSTRLYVVTLLIQFLCRIHHAKCWTEWMTS